MPIVRVIFTMDNLGDAYDLRRGIIQEPRPMGMNPPIDVGLPSMLELFAKHEVKITYFVEGWSAKQYPNEMQRVLQGGHSIGMHGWMHEVWHELEEDEMNQLANQATAAIQNATQYQYPIAFRAPGGLTTATTIQKLHQLGYTIDASRLPPSPKNMEGDDITRTTNLCNIPFDWETVDATHWLWDKAKSCVVVEKLWKQVLDSASQDNSQNNKVVVFIWHPHIMGISTERIQVGDSILQYVKDHSQMEISTIEQEYQRRRLPAAIANPPAT